MSLMDRVTGKSLKHMDMKTLRIEEQRIKNRVTVIRDMIDEAEERKKKAFREGVGADPLKKKMLLLDIKDADADAKKQLATFLKEHGRLRLLKNVIIVKQNEKRLRESGLWKKLSSIQEEKYEEYLYGANLEGSDFDELVSRLNRAFDGQLADWKPAVEAQDDDIMKAWRDVESGNTEPEKAEAEMSVQRELVKDEEPG